MNELCDVSIRDLRILMGDRRVQLLSAHSNADKEFSTALHGD